MESHAFIAHAERLVKVGKGKPRQVELRRAISAAYYSLFHKFLEAAADDLVGTSAKARKSAAYRLIYRGFEHSRMRAVSIEASKAPLPNNLSDAIGQSQFSEEVRIAARAFVVLQQERHRADYDPQARFSKSDTRVSIEMAKHGGGMFELAGAVERRNFLLCMLLPRR